MMENLKKIYYRDSELADLDSHYKKWLIRLVGSKYRGKDFSKMLLELGSIIFVWFIPNDDNRIEDGRSLRDRFLNDDYWLVNNILNDTEDSFINMDVSVLEVLVAMAIRMDDILGDLLYDGDRANQCFWEMLTNIDLILLDDDTFIEQPEQFYRILHRFIYRSYDVDGYGGLFPLNDPEDDQTKVELWYQMNRYLVENYFEKQQEM